MPPDIDRENLARLDTQNVRQLGVWSEPQQRKSLISTLCLVAAGLIAGIGWMVFGLV